MELSGPPKRGYHHGDLRNALGDAAARLARDGGPESVTVRAAARLAGVTPTAAYRHFAGHGELLAEAKQQCMAQLGAAIEKELRARPPLADRAHRAVRDLAVAGRAYIDFAVAEPGLFRTAFTQGGAILDKEHLETSPFGQLVRLIDRLVEVGYLPERRRPLAEVAAWSAVHGLAHLLLDGPLRDASADTKDEAIARTILAMERGLCGAAGLSPELEEIVLATARRQP
ncbi:MAG TPA: TetR/AcrR family transcriptional regulator [Actinophytocola sp.]|uniref:TetR/AcrR family transcriptional regulator n=1 Tax=Actinophytocola sp. TaxID=1872138 RepID=UPI002DBEAAB1|nr:TetR/AcrR family transcriptional regulator [Actinophytocola sp.]HEU5474827.1 TetR/AcrR family transcriptional regulator [Actinophytocola sp.]